MNEESANKEFDIRMSVALPATPEQVWAAIATPDGQATWFMPGPESFRDPATDPTIEAWDPPRRLRIVPTETMAMEYLIEAVDGGGAVLRFVHSGVLQAPEGAPPGWGDEFDAMNRAGWDMYLHTLAAYLTHFPGRAATYAEAEAPAADGAAWERIRDAFGRPDAPGGRVGIDLAGQRLVGEIDYVTDRFLCLRTANALIRFHERSPIGMPVAVSHHDYDGADPEPLAAAWREWLAGPVRVA